MRDQAGAWLVEADLAGLADAKYLEVNSAAFLMPLRTHRTLNPVIAGNVPAGCNVLRLTLMWLNRFSRRTG